MGTGAATSGLPPHPPTRARCASGWCRGLAVAGLALVSACDLAKLQPAAEPVAAPELQRAGPPAPLGPEVAGVSGGKSLVDFYAGVENDLIASGRMRRDTAPVDVPFSVDDLVRDFVRVALYDEYVDLGGRFVRSETPALLRRWDRPVRVGVMVGPSVPPEAGARDRANVAAFTQRLAGLTGLDMSLGEGDQVNFLVLFMNSAERTAFAEQVSARYPGFAPAVMSALHDTPLDTFCTAYAFSDPTRPSAYAAVIILIRAEHPPLTKMSCVNEEMAQAMGLPNDSPESRPSLFNDNLEFALLTDHDAILLRMLYDPRLRPGMTAAEVRPLLPAIARDAMAAHEREQRVASAADSF